MKRTIILYADDDDDDRYLMREAIGRLEPGAELLLACDGSDALDKLAVLQLLGQKPALIILDMNMPKLDGRETLEQIRMNRAWDGVPVCIYSTSNITRFANIALKYEVEIVSKPMRHEDIIQSVQRLLEYCRDC